MHAVLSRLLAAAGAAALAGAGLVAVAAPASAETVLAPQLLDRLTPGVEANASTYDRDLFQHWIDADGDGCDTREEVLIAESIIPATTGAGCAVSGRWISYYDGATWDTASAVDIDHLVPLAEAWRSGASAWTDAQRRAFANDLDSGSPLVAVTDVLTQSKGDRDIAQWVPPLPEARCRYAIEWAQTKVRWRLTVDQAERNALSTYLQTCGSTPVEVPPIADVPAPHSGGAPVTGDTLRGGQTMAGGQWLMSADRTHGLSFQADGNLVAYAPNYRVLWSSATYGNPGARFTLQADGNAVIYAADGRVLWHAGTYGNPGADLRVQNDGNVVISRANGSAAWYSGWDRTGMVAGDLLTTGQQITSANGRYHLIVQRDGNVVVYHSATGRPLFFTGSYGAASLRLQGDGNLVAYNGGGGAHWHSDTWREGRSRLEVQDDGNVVLYRADGSPSWYSGWDTGRAATGPGNGTHVAHQPPAPPVTPQPSVYYADCDAVRAAGAAPLHSYQPGYRSALDRDSDGVACE